MSTFKIPPVRAGRRAVLAGTGGAALVLLVGCSSGSAAQAPPVDKSKPLAAKADVPVGGGVVTNQGVVVTQPSAGEYLGFSAICTHQGCTVSAVTNGVIVCPCHGSQYKIADGSVSTGPANRPLGKVDIVVRGDNIFLA
jgi:Rieske Fe-S protein